MGKCASFDAGEASRRSASSLGGGCASIYIRRLLKVRGPRLLLITAGIVFLLGIFLQYAPTLYSGATIGFVDSPKLGPSWIVSSRPNAVFVFLLAALVIFALYKGARRKRNRQQKDPPPVWICPACHEENPGNFEECWKCNRIRHHKEDTN